MERGGWIQPIWTETPVGVNMVLLITEEALFSAEDMCAIAIAGRNSFNEVMRQKILDFIQQRFLELSIFVETWYHNPSPIWMYIKDNDVAII